MKKNAVCGLLLLMLIAGCASTLGVPTSLSKCGFVGAMMPGVDPATGEEICEILGDMARLQREYPAEEEYYLGQAVTATAIAHSRGSVSTKTLIELRNPVNEDRAANSYIAIIGKTLSLYSRRPDTYGGYHFQIVNSDEINALSSPAGHILVTSGLLRVCESEDDVAAVLAHEIAHVSLRHGVKAVSKRGWVKIIKRTLMVTAKEFGGVPAGDLADAMSGAVGDVTEKLIRNGYDQKLEFEADAEAIEILEAAGYDPRGIRSMLTRLNKSIVPKAAGLATTHPNVEDRLAKIEPLLAAEAPPEVNGVRQARFDAVRNRF